MKRLFCIILCSSFIYSAGACDICGCGVGSYYLGILPEFNKKILGLRYRHNSLQTHLGAGGSTSYLTTDEAYHTAEMWGAWTIGNKFRILGYVPFNFNERRNQGKTFNQNGLGDIGVQGFYQLINKIKSVGDNLLVQSLWLGAGIKLPTGKYDVDETDNSGPQGVNIFQLGTGSADFTANAMYDIRLQDAGISTSASYKINTANKFDYRYGNKFSLASLVYYKWKIKNTIGIAPNAGILFEAANQDRDERFRVDVSGGNMVSGTMGLEINFKRIAIGGNWQAPLSQNLAGGFVKANNRVMVHVAVPF